MTAPMTLEAWTALTPVDRTALWAGWTVDQRRDMAELFIAYTPDWNLRYPSDYYQPADSPLAFSMLATDVDGALTSVLTNATTVVWDGFFCGQDAALPADAKHGVLFDGPTARPPGTQGCVSAIDVSSGASVFTVSVAGLYLVESEFSVQHATNGTKKTFQLGIDRWGAQPGDWNVAVGNEQIATGWPHWLKWTCTLTFSAGDGHMVYIRPVGSTATGWTMTDARHTLTRLR